MSRGVAVVFRMQFEVIVHDIGGVRCGRVSTKKTCFFHPQLQIVS